MNELNQKLSIIVVDDSGLSRKTTIDILKKEGYNIVGEASNAAEAIDVVSSTFPNLLIVDVVMPGQSGLELTKTLKTKMKNLSIIVMSSLDDNSIVVEAIAAGANDFLTKPFSPEDLIKSVQKIQKTLEEGF